MAPPRDNRVLAGFPHGVITVEQLGEIGISDSGIRSRIRSNRLHRIHRGVYAIGREELSQRGLWLAAVLSYPDAVLSHRSAAELWRLLPEQGGPIHVAVDGRAGKRHREGVKVHRLVTLRPSHKTVYADIPVTTVARTLHDLARTAPPWEVRRARRQAEYLRYPVKRAGDDDGSASDGEAEFLMFCVRFELPEPEVNIRIGPFVVDFLWREKRLIVEVDEFSTHGSPEMFAEDRRRDLDLRGRGFEVLRLTTEQLRTEPAKIAAILRSRLG